MIIDPKFSDFDGLNPIIERHCFVNGYSSLKFTGYGPYRRSKRDDSRKLSDYTRKNS